MKTGTVLSCVLSLAVIAFVSPVYSQTSEIESMAPARTLGLAGMGRSFGSGANALYLNPAALRVVPQYVISGTYGFSNAAPATNTLGVGWTDSSPNLYNLAFGLGYNYRFHDDADSHNAHFALAYSVVLSAMTIHLGVGAHRLWNVGGTDSNDWTGDMGMVLDFSRQFLLGVSGYNLITSNTKTSPRGVGGGLSYWRDRFMIGAEISMQAGLSDGESDDTETHLRYMGGLQFMVAQPFSLRAGVNHNTATDRTAVSAGFTFLAQSILGFEAGYQQNVGDKNDFLLAFTIELYNPFGSAL